MSRTSARGPSVAVGRRASRRLLTVCALEESFAMRLLALVAILALTAVAPRDLGASRRQDTRGPSAGRQNLAAPRTPPLAEAEWTGEHRELIARFAPGAKATNDLRTFLNHPELVRGVMPFAVYVTTASTLPARDRALLILRTARLARSEYLWAKHAADAEKSGLSADEIARVAAGPGAAGWPPFDALLLRAADELHRTSFIPDATWSGLAARYGTHQLMDAAFTVAELTMLAGMVNSVGVQPDVPLTARAPAPASYPASASRTYTPLTAPRIPPLDPASMSADVRTMLDPAGSGRSIAAVYRTFGQHPALYVPRQILSEYIRQRNTLPPRVREMLILRIGFLCGSEYEWAAHARAGRGAGLTSEEIQRLARGMERADRYDGWSAADAALVRAVDELYASDTLSDATWTSLAAQLDRRQLLDLLVTTGGYRMVSMVLNTFGVPLEPNSERFPAKR
jgi:alkylhydroperoxidase family enzyme